MTSVVTAHCTTSGCSWSYARTGEDNRTRRAAKSAARFHMLHHEGHKATVTVPNAPGLVFRPSDVIGGSA